MKSLTKTRQSIWFAVLVFLAGRVPPVFANPTGLRVGSGSASAQQLGSRLNVTVSQAAVLNWSSFNIAAGETTSFLQPSANSVVLNVIGGANPSQIFGSLNANGTVILENANGFYFGPDSMIKVGGSFIATTAPIIPDFGSGSSWQFSGMPPLASIVNYGQIEVGQGRSLFLIAEKIENHGSLTALGGNVDLAAGQSVLVSDSPDGRGLSATVTLPSGSVDNFGRVTADAGTIALEAKVVNQNGILQANSVQNQNGVIELVASDTVNLGANSQIFAQGDNSAGSSAGGDVTIKSGNNFSDSVGSHVSVAGGSQGGNGGSVEISAGNLGDINSLLDGSAQAGFSGGKMLLDPTDLTLNSSALNPYSGFDNILFQATGNITVSANTRWNLSSTTGQTTGQLTLEAGGDITFGTGAKITDANNWSVTLEAGYDFTHQTVVAGGNKFSIAGNDVYLGNIYLSGGSSKSPSNPIQLSAGSLTLLAGIDITVGKGSVFTTGGGSIFADAVAGNLNAGTANGGYVYNSDGSVSIPDPGGIATAGGGNVTLIAGNNVISVVPPTVVNNQSAGASGAYGAGNVTVIAGNQVTGNFNLANGVGTVLAGVQVSSAQAGRLQNPDANPSAYAATLGSLEAAVPQTQNLNGNIGTVQNPITLGLLKGSWNAWAANNISLLEVQNPNGTYNGNSVTVPSGEFAGNENNPVVPGSTPYLFDYAPDAAVHLWAGNGITLGSLSQSLTRQTGNGLMPSIYAPVLSLDAGAGGITVDNSLFLYPSSQGSLQITTRAGGNLVGAVPGGSTALTTITMSDSGLPGWNSIVSGGHALTPLHRNDPNPVTLDISGSIGSFGLDVPTFAQITVHGTAPYIVGSQDYFGTYNFGFSGRNLSPLQTTAINVTGDINYRGDLTTEPLVLSAADALLLQQLAAISTQPGVFNRLLYVANSSDASKDQLVYVGAMDQKVLNFLLNPTVFVFDRNGNPVLDANGNPETTTVLTAAQQALLASITPALKQLYTDSQSAAISSESLAVAGFGVFKVTANNINLGNSGGITVNPLDAALAKISLQSAALDVHAYGDLTMTASKIANQSWLGDINLTVDGTLNVGGQFTAFDDSSAAKGIFTTSGGNVSVVVNGDVNVNGSRIAAYNGGNITVESLNGDVNAGVGGAGYVSVNAQQLNPNGSLGFITQSIPGSGILATTLPGSDATLGNITIKVPHGSLNANLGGVLQIAFNGTDTRNAFIDIATGQDINANGSGIIGSNIKLTAGGSINGVIIGSQGISLNAAQNVDVTAVSGGNVDISAAGTVAGTIVGGGNVSVSGDAITAAVMGGSVSASGDTSGASLGIPQSNVSKEVAETSDANAATQNSSSLDDDELTKKKKGISLAQKVSRVTVLLPKKVSEKAGAGNPL
jgi:filamentous hemagglutinin family protein